MDQSYPYRKYSGLRMQQENTSRGGLQVTVLTEDGTRPVEDAVVRISYTGEPDPDCRGDKNRFFRSDTGSGT